MGVIRQERTGNGSLAFVLVSTRENELLGLHPGEMPDCL
jgi:hypothetical protein